MLPAVFFFDKDRMTNLKFLGVIASVGILGNTIKLGSSLSTFSTTGNRCCSGWDRIFLFNYDGGIHTIDSSSLKSKALVQIAPRPLALRNPGSTCTSRYMYAVNGTTNGLGGLLGSTSNTFHRYDVVGNSWSTLAVCPLSVINSEIAINYDLGDYIYYTSGSSFYRYSLVSNTWSSTGLSSHGLILGVHALVYYKMKLYLASGNVLKVYDIVSNTWSTLVTLPLLSTAVRMIRYRDNLYIFGGLTGVMEYSLVSGVLRTINSTINLSGDLCAGVIYGSGYIVGGSTLYSLV